MRIPRQRRLPREMSRRQLLLLSAATGATLLLPAAPARARQDTPSDQSGTFRAISWETEAEMRKWFQHMNAFFENDYPNMTLEVEYGINWDDYWTKLQTTVAGGAQLDMVWMHDSRVQSYADLGTLLPLDDYIAASPPDGWPEKFYQSQVKAFQFEGMQYAIPYDWASRGLYVNLDVLDRAGVNVPTEETTFEQFLADGIKIKESAENPDEQWAFFLPTDSNTTEWVVLGFGGKQVTPDPLTSHFNSPETIAAYQYLYDAIWTHEVMPAPDALEKLGLANQVAFSTGRLAMLAQLNDEAFVYAEIVGDQAQWTMAPTPRGPGGRFQFIGGSGFSIPMVAEFPDIAYELMKFAATDPDNLPVTAQMGSMFVGREDFWEYAVPGEELADPEVFTEVFYTLGKRDGVAPLYFPGYQQWNATIWKKHMDRLWANATNDVTGVLQELHEETQAFLDTIEE